MRITFESVIKQIDEMRMGDWKALELLKPIAINLLKETFPNDCESDCKTIFDLRQQTKTYSFTNEIEIPDVHYWAICRRTLRGIVINRMYAFEWSKDDFFNSKEADYEFRISILENEKETIEKENLTLKTGISKLLVELKEHQDEHNRQVKFKEEEFEFKDNIIANLRNELSNTKKNTTIKNLLSNGLYWSIFLGFLGLLFFIGFYFGNYKYDVDKSKMRDSLTNAKIIFEKMRDSIKTLVPKKLNPK